MQRELEAPPLLNGHLILNALFLDINASYLAVVEQLVLTVRIVGLMNPHLPSVMVHHEVPLVMQAFLEEFDGLHELLQKPLDRQSLVAHGGRDVGLVEVYFVHYLLGRAHLLPFLLLRVGHVDLALVE